MAGEQAFCTSGFTPIRIRTVLAGTALDAGSDAVVAAALAVARAAGARLHVLHAVEMPILPPFPDAPWITAEILAEDAAERGQELAAQLERLGARDDEARVSLVHGAAHRALLDAARDLEAGLIVAGTARAEGPLERLLGSTADRLLRQSACPLLVVRGELPVPPARVAAPVDLTTLSADALRCGLHLLAQIGADPATRVTVLHALTFLGHLAFRHRTQPMASDEEAERAARAALASLAAACGEGLTMTLEPKLRCGDPRVEILAELEESRPELVVMGTHARRPLDRLLLGSIAALLAHRAPCSLLVVPPEAALGEGIAEAAAEERG